MAIHAQWYSHRWSYEEWLSCFGRDLWNGRDASHSNNCRGWWRADRISVGKSTRSCGASSCYHGIKLVCCASCDMLVWAGIIWEYDARPSTNDMTQRGHPFVSLSQGFLKEFASSTKRYRNQCVSFFKDCSALLPIHFKDCIMTYRNI